MKKISKISLLTTCSLLIAGAAIAAGSTLFTKETKDETILLDSDPHLPLNEKKEKEKNNANEETFAAKAPLATFSGTILLKANVEALGWNSKTTITLADWQAQAPNVTELGDNISNDDPDGNRSPFSHNATLQSIEIPDTVTAINFAAFYKATVLTTVKFKSTSQLTFVGGYSFKESGITTINIPNGVTTIGEHAFLLATSLTQVTFEADSKLESIQGNAFEGSTITSLTLPNSITTIANTAFLSTNSTLRTIQFPYKAELFLATNSYTPLYGFTQEQWDLIEWTNIPTKDVKVNSIIAKELLKQNTIISWKELSVFKGITADSFKNTSISAITIDYTRGFVVDENALAGTNELAHINLSERYKGMVNKLGLTVSQVNIINYIPISENSDLVNIVALSLLGAVVLLSGVGFFFIIKSLRKEDRLEKEAILANKAAKQEKLMLRKEAIESYSNELNEWNDIY